MGRLTGMGCACVCTPSWAVCRWYVFECACSTARRVSGSCRCGDPRVSLDARVRRGVRRAFNSRLLDAVGGVPLCALRRWGLSVGVFGWMTVERRSDAQVCWSSVRNRVLEERAVRCVQACCWTSLGWCLVLRVAALPAGAAGGAPGASSCSMPAVCGLFCCLLCACGRRVLLYAVFRIRERGRFLSAAARGLWLETPSVRG